MSEEFDPADYSFVVKRRGNPPKAVAVAKAAKEGEKGARANGQPETATSQVRLGLEGRQPIKRPL
jgi:hypothetical protein